MYAAESEDDESSSSEEEEGDQEELAQEVVNREEMRRVREVVKPADRVSMRLEDVRYSLQCLFSCCFSPPPAMERLMKVLVHATSLFVSLSLCVCVSLSSLVPWMTCDLQPVDIFQDDRFFDFGEYYSSIAEPRVQKSREVGRC